MRDFRINPAIYNSHAKAAALKAEAREAGEGLFKFSQDIAEAANHSTDVPYAQFRVIKADLEEGNATTGLVDFMIVHALLDHKEVAVEVDIADTGKEAEISVSASEIVTDQTIEQNNDSVTVEPQAVSLQTPTMLMNNDDGDDAPQVPASDNAPVVTENETKTVIGTVNSEIIDFSFNVTKNPQHFYTAACMMLSDTTLVREDGKPKHVRSGKTGKLKDVKEADAISDYIFSWVHDNLPEKDRALFLENCEKRGLVGNTPQIGFNRDLNEPAAAIA